MRPRLAYSASNFIVHSGVAEIDAICQAAFAKTSFTISLIKGARRSGKTHSLLYLAQEAAKLRRFPKVFENQDWEEQCLFAGASFESQVSAEDVFLVDDVDRTFSKLQPGQSGPVVKWIENLRRVGATLIMTSNQEISEWQCDEHLLSRLRPGAGPLIREPQELEISKLVIAMALQRGMALSARQISFLVRRLPRSLALIEEYLNRLEHLTTTLGKPIQLALIQEALVGCRAD